jgi:hypothetical protein
MISLGCDGRVSAMVSAVTLPTLAQKPAFVPGFPEEPYQ